MTEKAKPAKAKKPKEAKAPREKKAPRAPRAPKPPKAPRAPRSASAPKRILPKVGYVALVGRPNAGKSTLINALLGQKIAIVSDKPQTTRISILGIHTTDKGQIIFIDNPGIHKPLHKLNKRMMNFVQSSIQTADIICLLIDAAEKFGHGDEYVLESLRAVKVPVFLLINKVDTVKKGNLLLIIEKYHALFPFKEIVPISALKRVNLDVLERLLFDNLPSAEKLYGDEDVSDQSQLFLFSEIIREKVLKYVEQELPWATAVYIETIERRTGEEEEKPEPELWDEGEFDGSLEVQTPPPVAPPKPAPRPIDPNHVPGVGPTPRKRRPMTYIKASVFVEKDNQRKIIIGRQGHLIKQIGIDARREIEDIVGTKVYLELQVRVRQEWRDKADVLDMIEGQKER